MTIPTATVGTARAGDLHEIYTAVEEDGSYCLDDAKFGRQWWPVADCATEDEVWAAYIDSCLNGEWCAVGATTEAD